MLKFERLIVFVAVISPAADIQAKERQDDLDKDKLVHEGRLREMQMDAADEARQGGGIE